MSKTPIQEINLEEIELANEKTEITDKIDKFLNNIILFKAAILKQKNKNEFKKLAVILHESIDFFENKCSDNCDSENESADFSILESNENEEEEEEKTESYYSTTESEYNFDDTEEELKSGLVLTMKKLHENLKNNEYYENIEVSKRKNLF